ncbi:LexA family transcriptional regulator [Mesorhizobium sp. SP-1A]|uniref:XRE family transcriptional regulator n=1 Tax=Mesorhizobium sp. SP-1A TaxID=3077840 RepID=UPI0028F7102C|nr:LexA family transcriptional regulator [Mesorhizobium sp. SP-1A]
MSEKASRADRIKDAMRGRPIAWLAEQLGVALSTAHSYLKGTVPPADVAIKIANILEIDLRWYINGEETQSTTNEAVLAVPLVDTQFNSVGSVAYTSELLSSLTPDPGDVRCMLQKGTAMRPTIPENAETLFVPMTADPEDGRIYVLVSAGRALVRRVMQTTDGQWKAVCDNPAFRGEEKDIVDPQSFIGEVIWTSHRP